MSTATSFSGFDNINEPSLEQRLKANLPLLFDWCFVDKGAFFNVRIPNSSQYGNTEYKLKAVNDNRFSNGQVWEAGRKNWVWESGVAQTTQPIRCSGVYVNNTFYPANTSGTYSHYIDYPNGRVIFNNPISPSAEVKAEFSYKLIQIFDANKVDWMTFVQQQSFRGEKTQNDNRGSGAWSQYPEQRIQLPAIGIEISTSTKYKPYEIGSGAKYAYKNIVFYIIGEEDTLNSKLADIIAQQEEKTFYLFDETAVMSSGHLPLNYKGQLNSNAKTYKDLVELHAWNKMRISKSNIEGSQKFNQVYIRYVNLETETILFKV